ncbi:MAG: hypothetical protein IPG46_02520 [Actinobacteria bacterium]|nr:hypothetical protein [Actinomycetota bacterium]
MSGGSRNGTAVAPYDPQVEPSAGRERRFVVHDLVDRLQLVDAAASASCALAAVVLTRLTPSRVAARSAAASLAVGLVGAAPPLVAIDESRSAAVVVSVAVAALALAKRGERSEPNDASARSAVSNDGAQRWPSAMLMISLLGVYLTVPDTEVIVMVGAAALVGLIAAGGRSTAAEIAAVGAAGVAVALAGLGGRSAPIIGVIGAAGVFPAVARCEWRRAVWSRRAGAEARSTSRSWWIAIGALHAIEVVFSSRVLARSSSTPVVAVVAALAVSNALAVIAFGRLRGRARR